MKRELKSDAPVAIVGAGFSGATIARELAMAGRNVQLFEQREHVAGNCHTYRDGETGIMLHAYGPHIFHTDDEVVWRYVGQFDEFYPFVNRVKAITGGRIFSLPVNLLTINQFFNKLLSPAEARIFLAQLSDPSIREPSSFKQQALKFVGEDLYNAFFKGYTEKQWGVSPENLPASILKRLPVRFNYDDNYYSSRFQGIPKRGYTHIVEKMLDHPNILVYTGVQFEPEWRSDYAHVFYSGPIDAWFKNKHGALSYRTLDFLTERHAGDYQGNAVINYCDSSVPWTRITEHKHFSPWETHTNTVIFKEFSRSWKVGDTPYYPVRLSDDKIRLRQYIDTASAESGVTFVGRLGTYRYLDMHVTIREALEVVSLFLTSEALGRRVPPFVLNPLE